MIERVGGGLYGQVKGSTEHAPACSQLPFLAPSIEGPYIRQNVPFACLAFVLLSLPRPLPRLCLQGGVIYTNVVSQLNGAAPLVCAAA